MVYWLLLHLPPSLEIVMHDSNQVIQAAVGAVLFKFCTNPSLPCLIVEVSEGTVPPLLMCQTPGHNVEGRNTGSSTLCTEEVALPIVSTHCPW